MRASLLVVAILLAACQAGAPLGTTCERNDACASPLVCRFGRCRSECAAQRDCPLGTTCLLDANGNGSCALLDDPDCSASGGSCAAPLACVGRECVNVCTLGPECPTGSACVPIGDGRARCVRTEGVDAGLVGDAGDDAATDAQVDAGAQCHSPDCSGLAQVIAGDSWSCVRTNAGAVWCWGVARGIGRGGDSTGCIPRTGSEDACPTPMPLLVGGGAIPVAVTGVDAMDAQDTGGCYLAGRDVYCWGSSDVEAPLGRGSNDYLAGRVGLQAGGLLGGQGAVYVHTGSAIAVDASGHWVGWGANYFGELIGLPIPQTLAAPMPALTLAPSDVIATGTHHACAIVSGGGVSCWGANERHQADPSALSTAPIPPTPVTGLPTGVHGLALGRAHSCALVGTDLYCWGAREEIYFDDALDSGVPPDGGALANDAAPVLVAVGGPGFRALVPMRDSADICAIDVDDHLWCWGTGYAATTTPSIVPGLPPVQSAAVAWTHGCAITTSQQLWCWGLDEAGERGQGTLAPMDAQPPAEVRW